MWAGADRGQLEALARNRGVVVVQASGCAMRVLPACIAPGSYRYASVTPRQERLRIGGADPGAADDAPELARWLASGGDLRVDMTIVGRWEAPSTVRVDELRGACDGATHVVSSLALGAFTNVSAEGAGAETLAADGDARRRAGARRRTPRGLRPGAARCCARRYRPCVPRTTPEEGG